MKLHQKIILESIFWIHIGVIVSALFIGIFVSLPVVLFLVVVHRAHVFALEECILSKLHKKRRGMPKNMTFLQFTSQKIFGKNISLQQSHLLDYGLVLICISIAGLYSFL